MCIALSNCLARFSTAYGIIPSRSTLSKPSVILNKKNVFNFYLRGKGVVILLTAVNLFCDISPTSTHLFTMQTSSVKFGLITEIYARALTSGIASNGKQHL